MIPSVASVEPTRNHTISCRVSGRNDFTQVLWFFYGNEISPVLSSSKTCHNNVLFNLSSFVEYNTVLGSMYCMLTPKRGSQILKQAQLNIFGKYEVPYLVKLFTTSFSHDSDKTFIILLQCRKLQFIFIMKYIHSVKIYKILHEREWQEDGCSTNKRYKYASKLHFEIFLFESSLLRLLLLLLIALTVYISICVTQYNLVNEHSLWNLPKLKQ